MIARLGIVRGGRHRAAVTTTHMDARLALMAAASCGLGAAGLLFGALALSLPVLGIGAGLFAIGATLVLAGAWIPPLHTLALVLPLPPLYASDALRVSPALAFTLAVLAAWVLDAAATAPAVAHPVHPDPRRGRAAPPRPAIPLPPVATLLGALVLATVFAERRTTAAIELMSWTLALGLLFVGTDLLRRSPRSRHSLALTIAAVAGVSGAAATLQTLGLLPSAFPIRGSPFQRATLGFGWPNELGMFLALALPFSIHAIGAARTGLTRTAAIGGALLVGCGLLATFSRGSWVAVLFAPVVLFVVHDGRIALRVWGLALALGLAADIASGGAVSDRIAATIGDWVVEQRAALTLAGLLMFAAKPILGIGPGGFADGLESYGPRISWLWDYLPTAQNAYVQLAAETGLLGLGALLLLLVLLFRRLLHGVQRAGVHSERSLRTAALWSFTTALLLAFNEWIFAHGIVQLVVIGAAIGLAADADGAVEGKAA